MSLRITITSDARAAAIKLESFPGAMAEAIRAAMDEQNQIAIGVITKNRLRGQGPFPPEQHKLGHVTGNLWRSVNAATTKATISGNTVASSIGSNVNYAGLHEFGWSGSIGVPYHVRASHLRRKPGKKRRGRVAEAIVSSHRRTANIPARAPFKYGLQDAEAAYGRGISRAIVEAWERHMA